MDDKFILINLDDEKSKKVGEVLGNETCKKILDYLANSKEASENDIASALGMHLNTVEYNLKKLIDAGLVEKTKNFFWSRRGKKIPMYKLAKKHIIISPKNKKPSLNALKTVLPIILILITLFLILLTLPQQEKKEVNKFSSFEELKSFIEKNSVNEVNRGFAKGVLQTDSMIAESSSETADSTDFSTTNIQVSGVDEADIIKNDGKYIYSVSGNKVTIIEAYPAENMNMASNIILNNENIEGIFINDDKIIVISTTYEAINSESKMIADCFDCVFPSKTKTKVYIYDISDKNKPSLKEKISVSGNYYGSRMIENYVYVISNQYIYDDIILPMVERDGNASEIPAEEIYYSDIKDSSFQYTIISSVNIKTGESSHTPLLTGITQNVYVSRDSIYTTYTSYPYYLEPKIDSPVSIPAQINKKKTIINRFAIDNWRVKYAASGEVLGQVLNQFSMDEYNGYFRIATTLDNTWDEQQKSENNLYVLDNELDVVGKIEGLAPGEKIYSVRFAGERGYVVTFKKVDPLFVMDLSDPKNPEVAGKLKIPGYSDYLHPYDENHIIGVGKEAVDAGEERNFAWYQGIKMAIFDVTDVENPVELHKVVIGDRGTDSYALRDHKSFLFNREKELLVLPITLAEIKGEKTGDEQYGEFSFQGAYVYKINLENGFDLKGRISHYDEGNVENKSGYYWYGTRDVKRVLYINDVLYTISDEMIKANNLDDLSEIGYVKI